MEKHDELKQIAKEHLKSVGFLPDEIHEEYLISGPINKVLKIKKLVVDVVGIKNDGSMSVAIECGGLRAEKWSQLNILFDEVIQLPYQNNRLTGYLTVKIKHLEKEISELRANHHETITLSEERLEETVRRVKLPDQIISYITQNPTKTAPEVAQALDTTRQHVWDIVNQNGLILPKWSSHIKFCRCGTRISKSAELCSNCAKTDRRITFKCDVCGTEKTVLRSQYNRTKMHFCGRKCRGMWLGKHHKARSSK